MLLTDYGFLVGFAFSKSADAYILQLAPSSVGPWDEDLSSFMRETWPIVSRHTYNDVCRATSLTDALRSSLEVPGDVVECGVAHGGMSLLLALALKHFGSEKRLHMFDSFQGIPTPDRRYDRGYSAHQFAAHVDDVKALLKRHGVDDICIVHEGWFSETLERLSPQDSVALVHVDCDLYSSTKECLSRLYDRVATGGPIIFDDFNDSSGGEREAVLEHVGETGEVIHFGPLCQAMLFKGETITSTKVHVHRARVEGRFCFVSWDRVREDTLYSSYRTHVSEQLRTIADNWTNFNNLCDERVSSCSRRAPLGETLIPETDADVPPFWWTRSWYRLFS